MNDSGWWAQTIQKDLSQGDVLEALPLFSVKAPVPYLSKQSLKTIGTAWLEKPLSVKPKLNTQLNALAAGKVIAAVVLSHSCELDKSRNAPKVMLAPVLLLDSVGFTPDIREQVIMQRMHNMLPLPDVPGLGTCVADLRSIISVPRAMVDEVQRVASMTDVSLRRLSAQLVGFFLRLELPQAFADTIRVQPSDAD